MAGTMLFCTSKDAKDFTRKVLDIDTDKISVGRFWLIESREGPADGEKFRRRLTEEDRTFDSGFIGASEQDCQAWALDRQQNDNKVDQNIIVVVDARSAKDQDTMLVQKFNERHEGQDDFSFGDYGVLPKERNVWYSWRIKHENAHTIIAALTETSPEVTYSIYYGNKDHFTDEHGVFDVKEADRYCMARDQDVIDSEIIKRKFR